MKGIVFKELLTMMDKTFGEDLTEDVIFDLKLDSGGAYTTGGTYDYQEILAIVTKLSEKTGHEGSFLVKAFGKYLLNSFHGFHPEYFNKQNSVDFLKSVHEFIHVEVKKMSPNAELPEVHVDDSDDNFIIVEYKSQRPFADLAEGLIEASIEYYNDNYKVEVDDRSNPCQRKFKLSESAA